MRNPRKKSVSPAQTRKKERVKNPVPPVSPKRKWLFRLMAAVLSPLLFLLFLELGLRLSGFGYVTSFFLPSKIKGREVLIQNNRFAWRFLGPDMARAPSPLAVPKLKPPDTVRIFVFGESAAFGDPQSEFGLPRILEALLTGRYPGVRFEVANVAMTAINSHAILPIARDCARQNGDIWVIYMGNNEVVGPFGAGTVFGPQAPNLALIHANLALKATRTGQWLDSLLRHFEKRPASKSEWGGMEMFVKNQVRLHDPRMANVYANFEYNLKKILETGKRSGVKMVASTVASNLKDCAPFGSLHRRDLPIADLDKWDAFYQKGAQAEEAGRTEEAIGYFRRANEIDDTFAELHFRWGRCCLALGQDPDALREFTLARDQDTLRFRCDTHINEIIRQIVSNREQDGILFADAEQTLARRSPHDLTGKEFLYEHVHLNFEGNYLLALTFAEQVAKLLPEEATRRAGLSRPWPSLDACAQRLAWTDWNRYEGDTQMIGRLKDPPFTMQLNHSEQIEWLRLRIEQLLPATQPAALREAEAGCRAALAIAPDDWVLHENLARLQQKLGDSAGAAESWRYVAESLPHCTEGWEMMGRGLAEQGRNEEALAAFQKALQLEPDSCAIITDMAQVFVRQGRNEEAMQMYEKVLKLKPYWGPAHLGLGKILEARGRTDEAQRHFQAALRDRMNTSSYYIALGAFCFERGWLAPAATNFLDALRLNPADAQTHLNLGTTLGLMGRRPEAQSHYAEAVRLAPNLAEARVRLGIELGRQGNDAAAMEQFAEAVRFKPDLLEARLNLGIALWKQHREADALNQFQEVLLQNPTNAIALEYVRSFHANEKTNQLH